MNTKKILVRSILVHIHAKYYGNYLARNILLQQAGIKLKIKLILSSVTTNNVWSYTGPKMRFPIRFVFQNVTFPTLI